MLATVLHSFKILNKIISFLATPPTFTTLPSPQEVDLTQKATFMCSATGDDVKYEWTIGSGSFPAKVTGIYTNTLVIPDVRSSDDNTYLCSISNDGGSVSSDPVQLTVTGMNVLLYILHNQYTCVMLTGLPKVTVTPTSLSVEVSQTVKLTATVSGVGKESFTYQWNQNAVDIQGESARGSTLSIKCVTKSHGGSYECIVSNEYGDSDRSTAKLTVTGGF